MIALKVIQIKIKNPVWTNLKRAIESIKPISRQINSNQKNHLVLFLLPGTQKNRLDIRVNIYTFWLNPIFFYSFKQKDSGIQASRSVDDTQQQVSSSSSILPSSTSSNPEELAVKSIRKLVNKYESKPSHNHADEKSDEKISKKKSKLASHSSSSESSRHSDIKSSSSDVTLDKLKPSTDDKSIKQLIGKYDSTTPLSTSSSTSATVMANLKEKTSSVNKESEAVKSSGKNSVVAAAPATTALSATVLSTSSPITVHQPAVLSDFSSEAAFQAKFPDLDTITETDIKTEKAIQKLVDIYAQKNINTTNQTGYNKTVEPDPLQPIYYDFPNYYNFPSNVPATPTYIPTGLDAHYDYSAQFQQKPEQRSNQKTSDYHVEKSRPFLEAIKEVDSRSDHFDEFYEDQYFEEDTDKDNESKKDNNNLFSSYEEQNNTNQMNVSDLKSYIETSHTETSSDAQESLDRSVPSVYKTGNSDLTAIVHLNQTASKNKPQVRFKGNDLSF